MTDIRLGTGSGSIDVFASHAGKRYTTTLTLNHLQLQLGADRADAAGGQHAGVGAARRPSGPGVQVRDTNRGVEVTAPVTGSGPHTLVVTAN